MQKKELFHAISEYKRALNAKNSAEKVGAGEEAKQEANKSFALAEDEAEKAFATVQFYDEKVQATRIRIDSILQRYFIADIQYLCGKRFPFFLL